MDHVHVGESIVRGETATSRPNSTAGQASSCTRAQIPCRTGLLPTPFSVLIARRNLPTLRALRAVAASIATANNSLKTKLLPRR